MLSIDPDIGEDRTAFIINGRSLHIGWRCVFNYYYSFIVVQMQQNLINCIVFGQWEDSCGLGSQPTRQGVLRKVDALPQSHATHHRTHDHSCAQSNGIRFNLAIESSRVNDSKFQAQSTILYSLRCILPFLNSRMNFITKLKSLSLSFILAQFFLQ